MHDLTVLLGGARSGKSSFAVDLAHRVGGPVTYIATAPDLDDDMRARIARHRDERPAAWRTIEEQVDLVGALDGATTGADPAPLVIVDCLTLWTSNLLLLDLTDDEIRERTIVAARHAVASPAPVVAITNEVGLGVHPETELGRRYRDLLGWVNQVWVAQADVSLLLVAGQAMRLDDPWSLLGAGAPEESRADSGSGNTGSAT